MEKDKAQETDKLKEAYKWFYTNENGRIILDDISQFTRMDEPVYKPGEKIEDAIHFSSMHHVVHYIYKQCDTSLTREIEEYVGREREYE